MDSAPVYPKIAAALREAISRGSYAEGSLLPSEETLAAGHGVARNTVRRALALLEGDGLVATVPGSGRVVCGPAVSAGQAREGHLAYGRIAAVLRERIESGEFSAGQPLPSEARLLKEHGVSRGTVRRAYAHLEAAGLVVPVHGKGWFTRRDASAHTRTSKDVPGHVSVPGTSSP